MVTGRIIKWVEDRGFGFIRIDGQQRDVFVHISAFGHIPRSPRVGESVDVHVLLDENGKEKVTLASIPGLTPLAGFTIRRSGSFRRSSRNSGRWRAIAILSMVSVLVCVYFWLNGDFRASSAAASFLMKATPETQQFRCEGKIHCSEMRSKEEALFYIRNCPGTKMDGDHDGDPCERQFSR